MISGLNGSGKTHLLEALAGGHMAVEGLSTARPQSGHLYPHLQMRRGRMHVPTAPPLVRMFRPGELVAPTSSAASAASLRDTWSYLSEFVAAQRTPPPTAEDPDEVEAALIRDLVAQGHTTAIQVDHLKRLSGKRLTELSKQEFEFYTNPLAGVRDPFTLSATQVFLSYHERANRQDFYQWRYEKRGRQGARPLTDEEFLELFGPPPWEPLNAALKTMDLPYAFTTPEGDDDDYTFEAHLEDPVAKRLIKSDELSSGERTLLAIALSLFGASNLPETVGMPRLLLLDEPDTSLHPSMIRRLVELMNDVLSRQFGVKVIIVTHSPTTVAVAPEPSLVIMRRDEQPRLILSPTRDKALGALTVGIPTLSVKLQNRRQVFVEAKNDAQFYGQIYAVLRETGHVTSEISLEFIPAGKGEKGGGDHAVKRLVLALRAADLRTVFGIVDRDARQDAPEGVCYSAERRTLENFVYDPVIIGYLLLRQKLIRPSVLGLDDAVRHIDIDSRMAPQIAKGVLARLGYTDASALVVCSYVDGFSVRIPQSYLEIPKEELESLITTAFPPLKGVRELRSAVVRLGYDDRPGFIPLEIKNLFSAIAAAKVAL